MADEKKYLVHPYEAEAPERIWAWGWRADSVWQEQTWQHEDEPMSTMEYVRADLFAALTEQLSAARRDAEEAEAYAAELEANGLANRVAIMRLEARAERLEEALLWCSGSADFNEGGVARKGWLKVCAPLLTGGKDE